MALPSAVTGAARVSEDRDQVKHENACESGRSGGSANSRLNLQAKARHRGTNPKDQVSVEMKPKQYIEPLVVRGRIERVQPKGLPLINLGYNELPYGPTPGVADALARAPEMVNSYGGPGVDAVRDALGELHGLDPDEIICGNGSEELLDVIGRNFARPGDEILISQFGYIQFEMTARRVGATLVKAPERDFTTDVDALIAALSKRTTLLFLANPNNPTG
ncbi:MAG: aminotransferase class I/II-fold pyridoxal phosphate-dependent enzyme, partial [Tateyamaria sp.]